MRSLSIAGSVSGGPVIRVNPKSRPVSCPAVRRGLGHATFVGALLAVAVAAGPAAAQEPGGWTAPAYPGNTMTMEHDGPIVAGTVARVKLSGHAEWNRPPTDEFTTPYDISLFVQNPDVEPACAGSYGSQLQMGINLDLNASTSISGWVMQGDLYINPTPPASGTDWAGESLPFSVKPGLDRVLLCGFQRYIIDDVAGFQLPVRVEQPRCTTKRKTIRRGRKLRLDCNVSGPATVRFRGPRSRNVTTRLSTEDGSGTVSTHRLARGRYRVVVWSGELQLGRPFRIQVR
jgi:hypothetical protein